MAHSHSSLIPSQAQYIEALLLLSQQNRIDKLQRNILIMQYESFGFTTSATELGNMLGYHRAVINNRYGRLGHMIADCIGFLPNKRAAGDYRWWSILADGWNDQTKKQFLWKMHSPLAAAIEELGWVSEKVESLPEEIHTIERLPEGAKKSITVNAYERNPIARMRCINYYGCNCQICNFDFETQYGEMGKGYIHVHHLTPLSTINGEYEVNPISDLIPVCPNCHAMIHKSNPPLTIEQARTLVRKKFVD
jgi:5-methylcytosine-specific restriction protein A